MRRAFFVFLFAALTGIGWGRTIGLWKDGRSYITDGMLKTLQDDGWQTVILQGKDLSDEARLSGLDVVFLPGGWNEYWFADFKARRAMVGFVAEGKGVLAGAFRSGYTRTCNRPFFPEVGATYNRVNGPWIVGAGDSVLAKAIDKPFCPGGWDHLVVKVGAKGKVFAVSGNDPVGVYGEVYGGRYLVLGAFIGMDAKSNAMEGTARQVLLKSVDWLAGAPRLSDAEKAKQKTSADLDFLRRERTWDWTLNERGPDRGSGVIPSLRNLLAVPLESRLYTLQYMSQYLSGKNLDAAQSELKALKKDVDLLQANTEKAMAETKARIGRMSADELLAEKPADAREAMREKLFATTRLAEVSKRADAVIGELKPMVKTAKSERLSKERQVDLAKIPNLIERASATNAAIRLEVVFELGRIGDSKGMPTLIKMLKDVDEKVRINAIIGLGWMQAKNAVPDLISLAKGSDIAMRRRAMQALGQIGDSRAIGTLIEGIGDSDFFVAENAILALGWLKAKPAVTPLIKIVSGLDRTDTRQRGLALAAIRALGHIGDASALPTLEELAANADDYPFGRKSGKRITNIYSTSQSLGLQGLSELAKAEIKAGGWTEVGIKQADALAAADRFYGLTKRFNALAGRVSILRDANFIDEQAAMFPYLWEAGFTGVHQAWGEQDYPDSEKYVDLVRAAGDFDLLWVDIMPGGGNAFGGKSVSGKYGPHGVEKPGADVMLLKYKDIPAFQGFWWEETYPDLSVTAAEFEAWLKKKLGADFREKLGLKADFDFSSMEWNTWSDAGGSGSDGKKKYSEPLRAALLGCLGDNLLGSWKESQEWLRGMRKGCAFTYSVSDAQPVKYVGVAARAGSVIDVNGPETYQSFGRFNSFFMEMFKDGEARPVMSEFYNWYGPSPEHDIRGFAQHLMHGECFYNFALTHIFEQQPYDMWSWDESRWNNSRLIFLKARTIREYLAVPESAANVGLVLSELSILPFDPVNIYVGGLGQGWMQYQSALWTALNQSQIPTDIIWAESLTPEKLKRYRVLVLSAARVITGEQAKMLRDWVNDGGTLIASGTTSLFDDLAKAQKNYLLSDLFGATYAGHAGVSDSDKNDTYYWSQGGLPAEKVSFGLKPENFKIYIHRDIKPVKSLGAYTLAAGKDSLLPGMIAGATCEYDMPLGYDKVKTESAEVLAKFSNGDPALIVNKVGKGLCYFWTPLYPALSHVTSEWEMFPNKLDFWPNVRELLTAMVKNGLVNQNATLPVDVTGVTKEIEVTVRQQPEHNRWIVHLLDYDVKSKSVKNASMTVHPPVGKAAKRIFYPDTGTDIKFAVAETGITTGLREFEVHDMVVIEWQ